MQGIVDQVGNRPPDRHRARPDLQIARPIVEGVLPLIPCGIDQAARHHREVDLLRRKGLPFTTQIDLQRAQEIAHLVDVALDRVARPFVDLCAGQP